MPYPGHSLMGRGLTPLQKCRRYILQPQPNGLRQFNVIFRTVVGRTLLLCRNAVGVFRSGPVSNCNEVALYTSPEHENWHYQIRFRMIFRIHKKITTKIRNYVHLNEKFLWTDCMSEILNQKVQNL